MFQNTTAHFRIETGLIFQLAAITGKGKAERLREWLPIILPRCQNTWSDAKIIAMGTNTSVTQCLILMGKNCFCPLKHGDNHSFSFYCSLSIWFIAACVEDPLLQTGLGRCVQHWSSQGVKPLFSFLFTIAYLSFAYLSEPPVFHPPKPKRSIQSNFINLQNLDPKALGWGVARKDFISYVHKAK